MSDGYKQIPEFQSRDSEELPIAQFSLCLSVCFFLKSKFLQKSCNFRGRNYGRPMTIRETHSEGKKQTCSNAIGNMESALRLKSLCEYCSQIQVSISGAIVVIPYCPLCGNNLVGITLRNQTAQFEAV